MIFNLDSDPCFLFDVYSAASFFYVVRRCEGSSCDLGTVVVDSMSYSRIFGLGLSFGRTYRQYPLIIIPFVVPSFIFSWNGELLMCRDCCQILTFFPCVVLTGRHSSQGSVAHLHYVSFLPAPLIIMLECRRGTTF